MNDERRYLVLLVCIFPTSFTVPTIESDNELFRSYVFDENKTQPIFLCLPCTIAFVFPLTRNSIHSPPNVPHNLYSLTTQHRYPSPGRAFFQVENQPIHKTRCTSYSSSPSTNRIPPCLVHNVGDDRGAKSTKSWTSTTSSATLSRISRSQGPRSTLPQH